MKYDLGPRLVDVCPEYRAAQDAFEANPTEETWQAVKNAAWEFRRKVINLPERVDA